MKVNHSSFWDTAAQVFLLDPLAAQIQNKNNSHFQYQIALQNIKCELQISSDFLRFSKCFSIEMEVGFGGKASLDVPG